MKNLQSIIQEKLNTDSGIFLEKLRLDKNTKIEYEPSITTYDEFISKYNLRKSPSPKATERLPLSFVKKPIFKYILKNSSKSIIDTQFYKDLTNFMKDDLGITNYNPKIICDTTNGYNDIEISIEAYTKNGTRTRLGYIYIDLRHSSNFIEFDWISEKSENYIIQIADYIINYKL